MAVSNINNGTIVDKVDAYFINKKPSESTLLYLGLVLMIGFLVYEFIYKQTDKDLRVVQNQFKSVRTNVNNNRNYLSINTQLKLQSLKSGVVSKSKELDNTMYKISYVDNTLTELSYLLFDNKSWAKFVDNISEIAKKHHVEIKEIANKFYKPSYQKISHVVEIDVKSKSSFSSMVKFLNEIEESRLVVDVSELKVTKPDDKLLSDIKITVWGMKY